MFASRKTSLIKQLWRKKIFNQNDETHCEVETSTEVEWKNHLHRILKRQKEKQLEVLLQAIDSKGGENTDNCVLVPQLSQQDGKNSAAALCCKVWRWPEAEQPLQLRRMCKQTDDTECINPYHWSRLLVVETPPPPYASKDQAECLTPLVSTETGHQRLTGESVTAEGKQLWCKIAYWEHRERVGRLFNAFDTTVSIFQDLPHGSGMCLKVMQNASTNESVKRTRDKIGFGITLTKEEDGVWVYNRSNAPIFVYSPTLRMPNSRTFSVQRIQSGFSCKIFDYEQSELLRRTMDPRLYDGPVELSTMSISFAKGWGNTYSRQSITSCPCWLEVLLMVNR